MIRASVINLGGNVLAAIFSALSLFAAIHMLSVESWGLSAAMLGIGQFVGSLLSFGTQTKSLRDLSILNAADYAARALPLSISRVLIGVGIGTLGGAVFLLNASAGCVALVAGGVFVSLGALMPLLAARRYALAAVCLVGEKLLALVLSVMLLPLFAEFAVPIAISIAGLTIGALTIVVLFVQGGTVPSRSVQAALKSQWKESFSFGVASVAPSALLLDVSIVTAIAGPAAGGLYSIGSKLVAPLSVAATTVVQVLMPRLASSDRTPLLRPSRNALLLGSVATVVLCAAGVILVPQAIALLLGPRYEDSAWPIRVFVLNAGLVLVTRTLVTTLQAWRRETLAAVLVGLQVVFALVGIAALAPIGATAAAFAVLGSNALLALALVLAVARHRRTAA